MQPVQETQAAVPQESRREQLMRVIVQSVCEIVLAMIELKGGRR